jgi:hypothetical protein
VFCRNGFFSSVEDFLGFFNTNENKDELFNHIKLVDIRKEAVKKDKGKE